MITNVYFQMTILRYISALFLCISIPASAAVFTVGTPSGAGQPCTHGTIQSAIDAANNSAGADTIRLTRSLTYQPEANTINTAQELTIEGGYATCTSAADSTNTVVSGVGGAAAPVFTITAPTGAWIRLRKLTISGGDVAEAGLGGGIRFSGNGILEIQESTITNNIAGYGGGIYAEGTGSNAELVIGTNVVIGNNTARYNGGGVLASGIEMSMLDAGAILSGNKALGTGATGGYGGGLFVLAADRPSYAYVGSGTGLFGAIYNNSARYGGGVAIVGQSGRVAELQFFATSPGVQAHIGNNSASVQGGGIHVSSSEAKARLWNAALTGNTAPNGAAAYLASNSGLYVNFASLPPTAVGCTIGSHCGRISNNTADTGVNAGAIVYGESGTIVQLGYLPISAPSDPRGGMVIQNNTAGSVFGGAASTQIHRSIINNNTTSSDVIKLSGNLTYVADSTIAGNAIGGGSAILRTVGSNVTIKRSILWQPGSTVLSRSGGSIVTERSIVNENGGLGAGAAVFDPRFIDPARGDYGLRVGSRAVDYTLAIPGDDRDAYSQPREVDLLNPDVGGPRDVGALERQSLQPMVLNSDFDFSDLRLWTYQAGAWDGTQNASGGTGSGSWSFSTSGQTISRFVLGQQCVHLPGPGRYRLNGRGKGGGNTVNTRDNAVLAWEFRSNGSESCTSGTPSAIGELVIGSGTNWGTAAQPAVIDVSPQDFGANSSITIRLVAEDGGISVGGSVSAWFDGIVLDASRWDDLIFANGFEP